MHHVQFFPFCGLSMRRIDFSEEADARQYIADRLRRLRRAGMRVRSLRFNGTVAWESIEPGTAVAVPDTAGVLESWEAFEHECRECGSRYDDRDDAAACCAPDDSYAED